MAERAGHGPPRPREGYSQIDGESPMSKRGNGWKFLLLLTFFLTLVAIGLAIWGILVPERDTATFNALSQNDTTLGAALAAANLQITQLQSQLVEIMMEAGNATLLQNGTFIWGVSIQQDNVYPFATCNTGQSGAAFAVDNPGGWYRVGDLITMVASDPDYVLWAWAEVPVFRVDSITETGAVATFTVLTGGCFIFQDAPGTVMHTLSVAGSGFAVTVTSFYTPTVFNEYYNYPTPPIDLGTALQYSTYSLYQVEIHGVFFTVLYLDAPPETMAFDSYGIIGAVTTLEFNLYNFQPPVAEITPLGTANYIFPLTQKNQGAIHLQDDYNCWATKDCYLNLDFLGHDKLKAAQFHTYLQEFGTKQHSWIRFRINPALEVPILNGVFTLNYPFMFVLPSL